MPLASVWPIIKFLSSTAHGVMGKKEQDQLEKYRAELEVLRHEYELYFMGLEKRRPTSERRRLTRAMRGYIPGKDAIVRFRHQSLLQRLLSFERYWDRVLKAIEDGRYERDVFKADFRDRKRVQAADSSSPSAPRGAKATEAGAEAAAFLAQIGDAPAIGMRGQGKRAPSLSMRGAPKGGKSPVGLRGKPVGDPPPKKGPPIGLRGKPVGRPTSRAPAEPPPPAIEKPAARPAPRAPAKRPPPAIKMRGKAKKDDD